MSTSLVLFLKAVKTVCRFTLTEKILKKIKWAGSLKMIQAVEVEVEVEAEEILSDPIAVAFVYDYNIRIEVRPDSCYEQYEVTLWNSNEDSVIRIFVVNKFEHAMQKMHDLTVAFADRR